MKNPEDIEQASLFTWALLMERKYPELATLYAIPNGGKRTKAEAGILKATGVKAGVLDIHLPVARGCFIGLWIEMKAPGKIKNVSPEQKRWAKLMQINGHRTAVCDCWDDAREIIEMYLKGR